MAYFLCRLNAPRPTFGRDMTAAEGGLMMEHAGYLNGLMARDLVVLFGPVADPAGLWGCAVVEAEDEAEVQALLAEDPVVRADAGFRYDVFPMPSVTLRRSGA